MGSGPKEYPRTFVGIDLETTGLEMHQDRIIEIGAVRVTDGKIDGRFEALVNPGIPIPTDVVFLTGITNEDVADAPGIDDVLPSLIEFVGDAPLVAHNAPFDLGFLAKAADNRPEFLMGGAGVFDTLTVGRALVPRLDNHRLTTLAAFFGIELARAHRAGDDAGATALLLVALLGVLDQVGSAILNRMSAFSDPQTKLLIDAARVRSEGRLDPFAVPDHGEKEQRLLRYDIARGMEFSRVAREERLSIDLDMVEAVFEESGPIASRLPEYEERREQLEMMRAVGDSFNSGIDLIVEAGTGVGKSLAYLVPAAHFAVMNGERVIVSTNTKNLQEQLFNKDVPFLEDALDLKFSVSLLKGRGNYLCRRRWAQLSERSLSPQERSVLLPLVLWEAETRSGDVSEAVPVRRYGYLWSKVAADSGPCMGQKCPMNSECYLMQARRASQDAHIVIINHSLLFSDSETDNKVLGEYSYLICDEAHNLERVATEHLGRRASVWRARTVLDGVYRTDGVDTGIVADILTELSGQEDGGMLSTVRTAAERLRGEVEDARRAVETFFKILSTAHVELNAGRAVEYGKLRYRPGSPVSDVIPEELALATSTLARAGNSIAALADLVADSGLERADSIFQGLEFDAARVGGLADDLSYLAGAQDPDSVFWLEVRSFRDHLECELRCAPVSVAEKMGDFLYSKIESLIMTSATLTVDGRFDFLFERLGLDQLPDWKVLTLDVGSPYDYDAQALAVVAGYLKPPSSPGFNHVVSDLVAKLAMPATGGTLVLFTSRAALNAVFGEVRGKLAGSGKLILAQGHGGAPSVLLNEFARSTDSVLLATSSFWEGVDVPGRSLELLIIVKLPFPVPSDPVVQAHCERYEQDGERSFDKYMVPRTAIGLRQGFGRLIRSTTDTGAVVFLDSRLDGKSYGPRLLDELPTRAMVARCESELLSVVEGLHVCTETAEGDQ